MDHKINLLKFAELYNKICVMLVFWVFVDVTSRMFSLFSIIPSTSIQSNYEQLTATEYSAHNQKQTQWRMSSKNAR